MEQYSKKTAFGDDAIVEVHPDLTNETGDPVRPPTAVLFGWFAANHLQLGTYASIFQDFGYNTVKVIGPLTAIYAFNPLRQACYVHSILRIIAADNRLIDGGIVFMFMSTAGALCATQLTRMFTGEYEELVAGKNGRVVNKIKAAMAAVVFESAPCYIHNRTAANAVIEGLNLSKGFPSWFMSRVIFLYLWTQRNVLWDVPTLLWNGMREADFHCPEQYIYSTADHFMDAARLEALLEERRKKGKEIYILRVEDTDHVLIFRKHPRLYVQSIREVNEWGVNEYRQRIGLEAWKLNGYRSSL